MPIDAGQDERTTDEGSATKKLGWLNVSRRDLAYGMDCLVPGFYLWLGRFSVCLGGCEAEESYPGTVHGRAGVAVILPNYRIWTTYQDGHDPRWSDRNGIV